MVLFGQDAEMELELSRREERGVVVVTVRGSIDLDSSSSLESALDAARADGKPVVVDAHGVEVLDSTGLRVLLDGRSGQSRRGLGFALACEPDGSVSRLLAVAGAGRFLRNFPTVAAALTALRGER